jgi:hypothetical protein
VELQVELNLGIGVEPIPIEIGLARELLRELQTGSQRKFRVRSPIEIAAANKHEILAAARKVREQYPCKLPVADSDRLLTGGRQPSVAANTPTVAIWL